MKRAISWFLAVLITLTIAIFQFIMGTSYPIMTEVNTGKQHLNFELKRSYSGKTDCPVVLPVEDITISGYIYYRIYPSTDSTSRINLIREGDKLTARLPSQPPSGKLEYRIFLEKAGTVIPVNNGKPIIIRFLGSVSMTILVLQSIFILLTILFSNITGIFAAIDVKTYKVMIYPTVIFLACFVFILQPIMHKYSLNQSWTCWPLSWELGDNKILIALIVWLLVLYFNFKKSRRGLVVLASFLSIIILSVPHGFPGSEHDPINIQIVQRNLLSLLQLF
jgi:hypothetical protein